MIRHRSFLATAVVVALIGCTSANAQQNAAPDKWRDTLSAEIEAANLSGDLARIQEARALAERVATAYPSDALVLHYAGFANYREASVLMSKKLDNGPQLERAKSFLERSVKLKSIAESHVLIGAIDGQLIQRDPNSAMELGMASQSAIMAAMSAGPTNPRVWLIRGISTLFTPAEYGGGVDEGIAQLKRSIELFAKDAPAKGQPSWGSAEAHVWLGQAYEMKGDKTTAAAEYKKALEISPTYGWAKALVAGSK